MLALLPMLLRSAFKPTNFIMVLTHQVLTSAKSEYATKLPPRVLRSSPRMTSPSHLLGSTFRPANFIMVWTHQVLTSAKSEYVTKSHLRVNVQDREFRNAFDPQGSKFHIMFLTH